MRPFSLVQASVRSFNVVVWLETRLSVSLGLCVCFHPGMKALIWEHLASKSTWQSMITELLLRTAKSKLKIGRTWLVEDYDDG